MNVVNVVLSFITRPNVFHVHCVVCVFAQRGRTTARRTAFFNSVGEYRATHKECKIHNEIVNLFVILTRKKRAAAVRNKLESFHITKPNRSTLCWFI